MIAFYLDRKSGTPTYLQLAEQVRQALRLGVLEVGDQLPRVKDVVADLTINPNTVLKAYGELEHDGLITTKTGVGTFIARTLDTSNDAQRAKLFKDLAAWVEQAKSAGLDDESITAMFIAVSRQIKEALE